MYQWDIKFNIPVFIQAILVSQVKAVSFVIKIDTFIVIVLDVQRIANN